MQVPWMKTAKLDDSEEVYVMASMLELNHRRTVPSFFLSSVQIMNQIRGAEGNVGWALDALPVKKTFYTLSAWRDEESLNTFARSNPHAKIIAKYNGAMKSTVFRTWSASASALPLGWKDARERLSAPA